MRETEVMERLFVLFCRDPSFRRALYKLDPLMFRVFREWDSGG